MRTVITNVKAVLEQEVRENMQVILEDGKIKTIGQLEKTYPGQLLADEIFDGGGQYLAPGLIDIHLHGGAGYDFMDAAPEAFQKIADYHSAHGITSMLATTLAGEEQETLAVLQAFMQYAPGIHNCNLLGVHLEGPYFSQSQRGAQDPKYIVPPEMEQCKRFLETGCVKRISLAPELPGALELGDYLKSLGIVVSAGHTEADYDMIRKASRHGYSLLTHLYSGMQGVHRKGPFRYGGAVEAGLLLDEMAVEVIADGCHLPECLLKLIYKCKGSGKMILITDAMRGAGLSEGEHTVLGSLTKGQQVVIEKGVAMMPDGTSFAGSVASGDRLLRTMRDIAGVPLPEAVAMMTRNPARLLGIEDRKGSLRPGMDGDLILFDEDIRIKAVWVAGRKVV
ncbi:MAG: N-acetylglucosamine-6-phosphate deacetylase [Roseburia sp.]|nr:N-acetylglucosamine-6-phosphate deacetylase [Roseburia sp.]